MTSVEREEKGTMAKSEILTCKPISVKLDGHESGMSKAELISRAADIGSTWEKEDWTLSGFQSEDNFTRLFFTKPFEVWYPTGLHLYTSSYKHLKPETEVPLVNLMKADTLPKGTGYVALEPIEVKLTRSNLENVTILANKAVDIARIWEEAGWRILQIHTGGWKAQIRVQTSRVVQFPTPAYIHAGFGE